MVSRGASNCSSGDAYYIISLGILLVFCVKHVARGNSIIFYSNRVQTASQPALGLPGDKPSLTNYYRYSTGMGMMDASKHCHAVKYK